MAVILMMVFKPPSEPMPLLEIVLMILGVFLTATFLAPPLLLWVLAHTGPLYAIVLFAVFLCTSLGPLWLSFKVKTERMARITCSLGGMAHAILCLFLFYLVAHLT